MRNTFQIIILIGRPASGKSEIIELLSNMDAEERLRRYHIAQIDVLDDFPMLWTWFEEDDIVSKKLGQPRIHTDEQGYFKHTYQWQLLIERLSLEYDKRVRENPSYHDQVTTIIEFSRGSPDGGYADAFRHLSKELLSRAGIVYVDVSFEESLRKNRKRFNTERPHSILEHSLPDEKMERIYPSDDWHALTASRSNYLFENPLRVPYTVFENEDDVTSGQVDVFKTRLEDVLGRLWELNKKRVIESYHPMEHK